VDKVLEGHKATEMQGITRKINTENHVRIRNVCHGMKWKALEDMERHRIAQKKDTEKIGE
jgi:hypothetical protein